MSKNDINTAPTGTTLMAPGVAFKETRNGNKNYFVRCPATHEWMFRHQVAFNQLLKRFDNDLEKIGTSVFSREGKIVLEREDPVLFAELFPKKVAKPKKEKVAKESKAVSKAKKALADVVPDVNPYDDEDPIDEVDEDEDVDLDEVDIDEGAPVEALEVDDTFEEEDYEDIYNEIDSKNLEASIVE